MTVKCYGCGEEIPEEEARTISQWFRVCPDCYSHLKGLIMYGYFDSEEAVSDELVYEHQVSARFNQFA